MEVNRELRCFQDRTSSLPIQHRVPFAKKSTPCATAVTELKRYTGSIIIPSGGLPIVEAWSLKIACYFYTDISADSNEILVEKRDEFLTAGYVVFIVPASHTNFVQFVQNQNIVKTRLVFPNKARNAEILLEGFNDHFSGYWMHWLFMEFLTAG